MNRTGAAETLGGERFPLTPCSQNVHDPFKYESRILGFASTAGLAAVRLPCDPLTHRDQWLNTAPELIGDFP